MISVTLASGEHGQRIIWEAPPVAYSDMTIDDLDRFVAWLNEVAVVMRTRRRNARPVVVEFGG